MVLTCFLKNTTLHTYNKYLIKHIKTQWRHISYFNEAILMSAHQLEISTKVLFQFPTMNFLVNLLRRDL